jgi:hypothetical protein
MPQEEEEEELANSSPAMTKEVTDKYVSSDMEDKVVCLKRRLDGTLGCRSRKPCTMTESRYMPAPIMRNWMILGDQKIELIMTVIILLEIL